MQLRRSVLAIMTKPKRSEIEELLKARAKQVACLRKIDAELNEKAAPLKAEFEKKFAPLQEAAAAKSVPVQEKIDSINAEIARKLMTGIDEESGLISLPQVQGDGNGVSTLAEVLKVEGNREINIYSFFDCVPPSRRGPEFMNCLKVGIAPAEKFLGKTAVDRIARKPITYSVRIADV
jgi:hypothetical protein